MKNQKLKTALLAVLSACSFGCQGRGSGPQVPAQAGATAVAAQPQGGVDVGNMRTAFIPKTNAVMTFASDWRESYLASAKPVGGSANGADTLVLSRGGKSKLTASRAAISEISSPTALALQAYLKKTLPTRVYVPIRINGLEGVRANMIQTAEKTESDLYLVSERSDFIHISVELYSSDEGMQAGEKILSTVRVEYKGVAIADSPLRQIELEHRQGNDNYNKAVYSFSADCNAYHSCGKDSDSAREGVYVLYGNGEGDELMVGTAGYDHGRIIDLGTDQEVPFASVRIDGAYLVAPSGTTLISDIYTVFEPKRQQAEQSRMQLQQGHVYLIRTISWPDEDLITKVHVDRLISGKSAKLSYQKLVMVPTEQLAKQVQEANDYTMKFEAPLERGEVTLHSYSMFDNSFYSAFNFQFSTTGNMFITNNAWDLLYEGRKDETATFSSPHNAAEVGAVVDVGPSVDLATITVKQFPDPNSVSRDTYPEVIVGHTYLVYRYEYSGDDFAKVTYGAVKVVQLAPDHSSVHMQFRRIARPPVTHFQKWTELPLPEGVQTVQLSTKGTTEFAPLLKGTGVENNGYSDAVRWESSQNTLSTGGRPFGADRGFHLLGKSVTLESVTRAQVEALNGQFASYLPVTEGDLVASVLETYFERTVLVMRVEKIVPGESMTLKVRYFQRAKTN